MQLEKIIGKLKTEKYGSKILEEIEKYEEKNQAAGISKEKQDSISSRASKKLKTEKSLVFIESSGDESL